VTAHVGARPLAREARFTPFDRLVLAAILALLGLVGLIIAVGDHVGVRVVRFGPTENARVTSPITIQFSEEMDRDSVAARFRIEPALAGEYAWSGRILMFRPVEAMKPGVSYTVTLAAGAQSAAGRPLLADQRFTFAVRGPRVAYLSPVDGPVKNVWLADPAGSGSSLQVTHSTVGVMAYDISPDGARLVYAERNGQSIGADLKLLDLDSGEVQPLTSCGEVACTNPVWSPDGARIAFERTGSLPAVIPGVAASSTRVWLLDPGGRPPRAWPLIDDVEVPSHSKPRWSPDGQRIAVTEMVAAESRDPGVRIYDLAGGEFQFSRTTFASLGIFSPDGTTFTYPKRIAEPGRIRTIVESLEIASGAATVVSPPDLPVDQGQLGWDPQGRALTIARRYVEAEPTLGRQLYAMDPAGAGLQPLLVDPGYDHAFFLWEPKGSRLVLERALLQGGGGRDSRSQIWTFDPASGALTQVAANAFSPRWVP
jgi:Tol biopolymer transport system component